MTTTGESREQLIARHLPLAATVAARYRHTREPFDDLLQVARLGLVKAADRWDPDRGTVFSTFAVPTIMGELRRYFRDCTWAVRPPRGLQELYVKLGRTREALCQELGREPTPGELARRLDRLVEEVMEALRLADARDARSLDAPVVLDDASERPLAEVAVADTRRELARSEATLALAQLTGALPLRDREVLRLRFVEDLRQREIADRIGCSQMHVSRIIRESLERLRAIAASDETSGALR